MYLLNQESDNASHNNYIEFTFHYVSIKSAIAEQVEYVLSYLHSTMYLLNRKNLNCLCVA